MGDFNINIISVLVATLSGMVLGAFWYSPVAFGKAWMASLGKTPDELGPQIMPMLGSILASFVSALSLAVLIPLVGVSTLTGAIALGGLVGFGLVFPALLSDNLFCGWGNKLLLIQSGYRILYLMIMAIIIAVWPS